MNAGSPEVIVVGGGVIGCSCAYHLARSGARVMLLERDAIAGHASGGAAGMLLPLAEAHGRPAFWSLALRSLRVFPDLTRRLRDESGIDVELITSGTIYPARSQERKLELDTWRELAAAGPLETEWLQPEEVCRLEPGLFDADMFGALHSPQEHQVRSPRLTEAYARAARACGAELTIGVEVYEIGEESQGCCAVTSRDVLHCDRLVIAAGPWLNALLPDRKEAIRPVRGQLVALKPRSVPIRHTIVEPHGYLVPKCDGTVIVGATEEDAGFDCRTTAEGVEHLLAVAQSLCPALVGAHVESTWAGLRPKSSDGMPLIGPLQDEARVWLAGGHFRNGILLSAVTGEMIASGILHGDRSWEPFAPDRIYA